MDPALDALINQFLFSAENLTLPALFALALAYGVKVGIFQAIKYTVEKFLAHHPQLVTKEQMTANIEDTKKFVSDLIAYNEVRHGRGRVEGVPTIIDSNNNPTNITSRV